MLGLLFFWSAWMIMAVGAAPAWEAIGNARLLPDWSVTEQAAKDTFPLVARNQPSVLWVDQAEDAVVSFATAMFADDVERVTGQRPEIMNQGDPGGEVILVGTLQSRLIDRLVKLGKLKADTLQGTWESFRVERVMDPLPGVPQALVVVGSDARGAAYGLMTLSEAIGVSPWWWWADLIPEKRSELHLRLPAPLQDGPDVRYRGIFINDEKFGGLFHWAGATQDIELNNIGHTTRGKTSV